MDNSANPDRGAEAADRPLRAQAGASTNGAHNGPAGPDANGQAQEAKDQAMRQAEEMADHLAERIGYYASWLSRAVMRLAARAREEAADIWAEAEHLSRKGRS